MRKATIFFSLFLLAAAWAASATTVLPIRDGSLADQATVIAVGTVIGSGPSSQTGSPVTEYHLRVERLVKGEAPGGVLVVRVLGGRAANGLTLKIWGAPEYRIGERALLFLVPNPDGSFGPLHLTLGAFHELRSGAARLAIRDLTEVYQIGADGSSEPVRDLDRFSQWLADRAKGIDRDPDYLVAPPRMPQTQFNYLGGVMQRWLQFDNQQDVLWQAQASGQPLLAGGGFTEFQAALQAWVADPATNIRYKYDGTTTATTGFTHPDGRNAIIFEDPNREAPGSFSCSRPGSGEGVLAIGGAWFDDSTSPAVIGEGDIVVNDGAGCWFTTAKRAEQVYAHELGHTLGLGHSCGDSTTGDCDTNNKNEALMRANAHTDNRGAQLGTDDRAGILTLYPGSDGSGGGPAAPGDLEGAAGSSTSIVLNWSDNSNDETQFIVEMKKGAKFKTVKTLKANVTTATITGLGHNKSYTFRVRAKRKKVVSEASNEVTVQTLP